jgi:tetratricopeptide (TPR) repeat protein
MSVDSRRTGWWVAYAARVGVGVLLVVLAWGLMGQTRREIRADATIPRIRQAERLNPLSRPREIRVRQALALDPGNATAVEILARHLVAQEKGKLRDGYLALIDEDSIRECLKMLERRRRVYAAVPDTTRLQGEIHLLLWDVHRRRGESEKAAEEAQKALAAYRRAIRELPEPRILRDEFYIGAMLAAANAEDAAELIDVTQRMDRDWRRYAINEWSMYDDVARAYYMMGMHGHQVREMRYALVWDAWNDRLIPGMELAATRLGQEVGVRHSLRSVRPRDHAERDAERLELLAKLEENANQPNVGSEP